MSLQGFRTFAHDILPRKPRGPLSNCVGSPYLLITRLDAKSKWPRPRNSTIKDLNVGELKAKTWSSLHLLTCQSQNLCWPE